MERSDINQRGEAVCRSHIKKKELGQTSIKISKEKILFFSLFFPFPLSRFNARKKRCRECFSKPQTQVFTTLLKDIHKTKL